MSNSVDGRASQSERPTSDLPSRSRPRRDEQRRVELPTDTGEVGVELGVREPAVRIHDRGDEVGRLDGGIGPMVLGRLPRELGQGDAHAVDERAHVPPDRSSLHRRHRTGATAPSFG